MGLPGKRLCRSSKRRRASHFALTKKQLSKCPKCAKAVISHRACPHCGTYKNKEVITLTTPRLKKTSEKNEKQSS